MDGNEGTKVAKRNTINVRYDILDPTFLQYLARLADFGAKKYGDENWKRYRLVGNSGPINHIYNHLRSYQQNEPYEHPELGTEREWHLAAIAFNVMMEFSYEYCSKELPKK